MMAIILANYFAFVSFQHIIRMIKGNLAIRR